MQPTEIKLTEEQQAIIHAPAEHCVVTAVAGSGKTTTLAHRIRYLLDQGYNANRILILMFNRAAKEDFSLKLSRTLPSGQPAPEVRTFHAMGYRLYQRFIREGALPSINMNVLSDKEVHFHIWRLMNQFMDSESLVAAKRNKKDYIEAGHNFIETVKNSLSNPQVAYETLDLGNKFRFVIQLFDEFEQWRKDQRRITYTDMLYDTVKAIGQNSYLLQLVSNKMDIILVDEYQDTNDLQHALLRYIAGDRSKITVVGDPDQTIYEFRGAKPEYIINGFTKEFSGAQSLTLSYSFRYGHKVSLLANHLIHHNKGRQPILCKSHPTNPNTSVTASRTEDEATCISEFLKRIGVNNDTTILARVWSQLAPIELSLTQHEIPYRIEGNKSVFSSVETQCIVTILELASGSFYSHEQAIRYDKLLLLMKFPHVGINETQIGHLANTLSQLEYNLGSTLKALIPSDLHKIQQLKLERFSNALTFLESRPHELKRTLLNYFIETDLFESIRTMSLSHDHAEEKIAMIQGIYRYLIKQQTLVSEALDFLNHLQTAHQHQQTRAGLVLLTTIHRSKGLEWDTVLVPGLKDKTIPYTYREDLKQSELESERRLLYVAMTRAKRHLHLFLPESSATNIKAASSKSCFEYELQLDKSINYGSEFYGEETESQGLIKLPPASKIIKQYAAALELSLPEVEEESNKENSTGGHEDNPVWLANIVEHTLLGQGRVTSQSSKAFSVCFDDQTERTFSKEVAPRFFTVVES